jgi:hypothetical protein
MYNGLGEEEYVLDFGGKARRKGALGRPSRRWENKIKMDLRKIR